MSERLPDDALCPLDGSPLYLIRSFVIPILDDLGAQVDPRHCVSDGWEVVCEAEDHRLGSGNVESDGRSALIGYRLGQSLGGLR